MTIGPLLENQLVARLEQNRILRFLRLIDPHNVHAAQERAAAELIGAQQRKIAALTAELAALRLEAARADGAARA